MSDIIATGTSGYETGSIDTATTLVNGVSPRDAKHVNGCASAIIQIETILGPGTSLKGAMTDLVTRLAVALNNVGAFNSGLPIPSPAISNPTLSGVISGSYTFGGAYTLAGSPTIPAFAGASLVFIDSINLASATTFTNLNAVSYDEHIFELVDIIPLVAGESLRVTFSIDNGVSFLASTGYQQDVGGVASQGLAFINVASTVAATVDAGVCGKVHLFRPYSVTNRKQVTFHNTYPISGSGFTTASVGVGAAVHATALTSDVDAIKFTFLSGTASGIIRHYGVKNA